MIVRQTTHYSCPSCKNQDINNFEEKTIVRLIPSSNTSFEIVNRKTALICRNCNYIIREVNLPNG